jgi:hypothetical protein
MVVENNDNTGLVWVLAYVANQGLWRNRGGERVDHGEALSGSSSSKGTLADLYIELKSLYLSTSPSTL